MSLDFDTFETVGAPIVVLDIHAQIVYWNRACSELTGYSLEEARGRLFWDVVVDPAEAEAVKAVFAKPRATEPQVLPHDGQDPHIEAPVRVQRYVEALP